MNDLDTKDWLLQQIISNPLSEQDQVMNSFLWRVKGFLLPDIEEIKKYKAKPKFYDKNEEEKIKRQIIFLLSVKDKQRLQKNSWLVANVLKKALYDDRKKSGQKLSKPNERPARYNVAPSLRYGNWERLLDFATPNLLLDSKARLDLLNFMYKFNAHCSDQTYEKLCHFIPQTENDKNLCEKIFEYIDYRSKRPNGKNYEGAYSPFVKNYSLVSDKFDENSWNKLLNLTLLLAQNKKDLHAVRDSRYDFSGLEGWLMRMAQLNPEGPQLELFAKIPRRKDSICKRRLTQAAEKIACNNCSPELMADVLDWMHEMVKKHDFSYDEIQNLAEILNEDRAGNIIKESLFRQFNTKNRVAYMNLCQNEVEKLNSWVYENQTDNPMEQLSLRNVYVNFLSERLVRDKSITNYDFDQIFNSHKRLVRTYKAGLPELKKMAEQSDGPKIDNLLKVVESQWQNSVFYDECMNIMSALDSNEAQNKQMQRFYLYNNFYNH